MPAAQSARQHHSDSYARLSTRPLHILAFLAPLIILYEIGSALYLTDPASGDIETIKAHRLLYTFFHLFDIGSLFLPGALLVAVLLLWHILLRDPWRIRLEVLPGMLAEAAAWTIPLVVLAQLALLAAPTLDHLAAWSLAAADPLPQRSTAARLTISIGAGIYEELLFRLFAIALIHFLIADILDLKRLAAPAAVLGSAIAFAAYHIAPGQPILLPALVFQFLAGLYFGLIYIWRGFGVVVAAHALYDVVALVLH